MLSPVLRSRLGLTSRIAAALFGGYAAAALLTLAMLALPVPRSDAVMGGFVLGFAVWAGAAIWAFLARTATRAWVGIVIASAPLASIAWPWIGGGQ